MTATALHAALNAPSPALLRRFADIVGKEHAIFDESAMQPYLREWRERYFGRAALVLSPGSVEEVSRILALASAERIGVVPQGGNTGLVGGQIPFETGREIVLRLARLNRVRMVDAPGEAMVVEAGVTLAEAQARAEAADRLFPLSLASEGSCHIGGNLATNAGGMQVLAYGNARDLTLGIEAVLPDGRVWDGLRTLRKDNTGFDLKNLFIGSEGTLGVITAAALRLFPRPREQFTALVGMADLDAAAGLFARARREAGPALTLFEIMPRIGMEFTMRHMGARDPLGAPCPWYALIELSSPAADGRAAALMEAVIGAAIEAGEAADAAVAASLAQATALKALRENMSEAQKFEGGSIKHDVSVPVSRVPDFIRAASAAAERVAPGSRPVPFGHFGDGNIHFNVSQPVGAAREAFLALWEEMAEAVHGTALAMGGSISAEHGVGRMKREALARVKSAVEMDLMRRVKAALDPLGVMNPGKVL